MPNVTFEPARSIAPFDALPSLGVGIGYRGELHRDIMRHRDEIDFLEVITEQFVHWNPEVMQRIDALRRYFPLIPHGVELSVGTARGIEQSYFHKLERFVEKCEASWFSDHLAFTRVPRADIGQLTPMWFTHEALDAICRNVSRIVERIRTPFLLENITYYFNLPGGEMTEAEFTSEVLRRTNCGMLLDVNNVHINSMNLGFDPYEFLAALPLERVVQIHLAGGEQIGNMVVDTHSTAVREEVWDLLRFVLDRAPVKGIVLEWDSDFPDFAVMLDHMRRARSMLKAGVA